MLDEINYGKCKIKSAKLHAWIKFCPRKHCNILNHVAIASCVRDKLTGQFGFSFFDFSCSYLTNYDFVCHDNPELYYDDHSPSYFFPNIL